MVSPLNIAQNFLQAAEDNPELQEKPAISIEAKTFEQILVPIRGLLNQDNIYDQMKELRQICSEVQVTHKTEDMILKQNRNELLNTLQGFTESFKNINHNFVPIGFDDIFNLPNLTDVIRGNAAIYREFMNEPSVADALEQVSDNIEAAQSRNWHPDYNAKADLSMNSSNDETYDIH